jgi:GTP-binding protein HflX
MNLARQLFTSSKIGYLTKCLKHTSNHFKGVQGKPQIKKYDNAKKITSNIESAEDGQSFDHNAIEDPEYDVIAKSAMHISGVEQTVFLIQPYIKWSPRKDATSPQKPDLQLQEAESLVRSLPNWTVGHSVKIGLESLEKKALFGKGKLEELDQLLKTLRSSGAKISSIFVSKGQLSAVQKLTLEQQFGLPVLDRYSVVIQILRLHATSTESKLQVAMAELPYIWTQMRDIEMAAASSKLKMVSNFYLDDTRKQMLRVREQKLKSELETVRQHRKLLRQRRQHKNYPIVAVVGYTNAGKTSLIKALTNEKALQPKDQFFATLDVTAHAALLPCNLKVIFMDTVGFLSDIPTGLIECFVATLEDAMLADLIIHIQDLSHENCVEQRKHVEETLFKLRNFTADKTEKPILNVGNKLDCVKDGVAIDGLDCVVSAKTGEGLKELLDKVEETVLKVTNRRKLVIKVPMGGAEMAWLYKNTAITDSAADPGNSQQILLSCIISEVSLRQFRHKFVAK